ncbi:MAG: peptide deformylase [Bacteroidales bacterium]|nr:peptide deformylase [Bacteroidales bacterium]
MILPIIGLGHPTLRKVAQPIDKDYPNLDQLIANMYETMYGADGVGLAAPQIDLSIRLVVIGFRPYDEKTDTYGPEAEEHTMINPEILEYVGEKEYFNEGCLSVPDIHEDVLRTEGVRVRWYDEKWQLHEEELHGMFARVAQHEIDHLEGKVFTDHLSPLRRTMIKRKMNDVVAGRVRTHYRMKQTKVTSKK